MGISAPFKPATPFFTGGAIADSDVVPHGWPIAISGHPYVIDPAQYRRSTLPSLRQPQDQSNEPGEQSLNTEGLWRRSVSDWILGAGQEYLDDLTEPASVRNQFFTSKGIDPWTRRKLTLLPDTESKRASANTNIKLLATSSHLYLADGTALLHCANPTVAVPVWVDSGIQAGSTPATNVTDMTTVAGKVYAALGANGVHQTSLGTSVSAAWSAAVTDLIRYVNGRMMGTNGPVISEYTAAGVATPLFTHFDTSASFVDIASGPRGIYFAVNTGGRGEIMLTPVNATSGALDQPRTVGSLPDGETINAIAHYQGQMILATSRGVRLASIDVQGAVSHGPVIEIPGGVLALEPQGEFVWFTWANFDGTSTGLGRILLTRFTDTLLPAFASDLMADGQGSTRSIASFNDRRYFAVAGLGIIGQNANKVETGTIDSGYIRFGTAERKVTVSLDVRHEPLKGSFSSFLVLDTGSVADVGGNSAPNTLATSGPLPARSTTEAVQVRMVLARDAVTPTTGPTIRRWTLRAMPLPFRTDEILVPIVMRSMVRAGVDGNTFEFQKPLEEYAFLKGLEQSRSVVIYQEGSLSYPVVVDRIQVVPGKWGDDHEWFESILMVRLLTIEATQN